MTLISNREPLNSRIFMKIKTKMLIIIFSSIIITSFTGTMIGQKYSRNYIQQGFRADLSKGLHFYASGIQNEIQRAYYESISLADDPSGIAWFEGTLEADEINLTKQLYMEKMNNLINQNLTAFAASKASDEFWIGNNLISVLDEDTVDDSWFYDTLSSGIKATTNVDSNDQLQTTSLWINVLMGDVENPVGVAGIGIELTNLVKDFIESKPSENSILMLLDSNNIIQVSSNNVSGLEKSTYFMNKDLKSSVVKGFENQNEFVENGKHYVVIEEELKPTDLKVILIVPEEDFVPSLIVLSAPALIAATILSIIMLASAFILIKLFLQSLNQVEKSINSYNNGDQQALDELEEYHDETGGIIKIFKETIKDVNKQIELNALIFDSTTTPLCFITPDNRIKEIGESLLKLTGYDRTDIEGKEIRYLFKNIEEYEKAHEEYQRTGKISDFEFNLKNFLNKTIIVSLNVIPMVNKEGENIGELITFVDISSLRVLVGEVREIASGVNSMAQQISESTSQINYSVQEVSAGTQEVAKGAQNQNMSAMEIVKAVSRVKILSENIVKKTESIANDSKNGGNLAQTGKELISDLLLRMDEMSEGANKVSSVMSSLDSKSREINKIVEVIS